MMPSPGEAEAAARHESNGTKMGDSEQTSPTASISEDSGVYGGFFGDIASLARSAKSTIDGVANIIHRSAMTVAAEIAQLERDAEMEAERWEDHGKSSSSSSDEDDEDDDAAAAGTVNLLPFPWQKRVDDSTLVEGEKRNAYEEIEGLKQDIFQLSTDEHMFLSPFTSEQEPLHETFKLDRSRVDLIRRMLDLDHNLASMHARLSGRNDIKEHLFWKNYFYHCDAIRKEYFGTQPFANEDAQEDDDLDVEDNLSDLEDVEVASRSTIGSLIPATEHSERSADDGSYICVRNSIASPPSSLNTLTETMSVGDMVLVGSDGSEINLGNAL